MPILRWNVWISGEPLLALTGGWGLKGEFVDPGFGVEKVVRDLGVGLFCDGGSGNVEWLESLLVGLDDVVSEEMLEVGAVGGMRHERKLEWGVGGWRHEVFVLHDLPELVYGHGFVWFFNRLSNSPDEVQFIGSVAVRLESFLCFE